MKPVWFIQIRDNDRDIATQNLIYAVKEQGYEVHVEKWIPFEDNQDLSFLPSNKPIVYHGSIGCARSVQRRNLPFRPFAWFDFDKLCCHSYYSHWGEYLSVSNYGFYPMGEIRRLKDWLYSTYGENDEVFIRPDTNDKVFTGEVVAYEHFQRFMNWTHIESDLSDVLCVVGTPTQFAFEYRLIIADNKVIAGSQYMDGHCFCTDRYYPKEAVTFAEQVAAKWSPHPLYCLDIGLTPNGFKVIECGSANCAGYYQCDLRPIVEWMSLIAEREYQISPL